MNGRSEIRALTGVRGVAASYVVLYHYLSFGSGIPAIVLRHGYLAVDLFFILSGFVMAMTYGHAFQQRYDATRHRIFILRRLGRIYPVYLVLTLLCVLAAGLHGLALTPTPLGIVANLLLVQAWGICDDFDGPAWSISTEFAAYLIFPWLALICLRRSWPRALIIAVGCLCCVGVVAAQSNVAIGQTGFEERQGMLDVHAYASLYPLLRCFAEFVLGLVLWQLQSWRQWRALVAKQFVHWSLLIAILVLLAVPQADLPIVILVSGLIGSLATPPVSTVARWFASRPVHWLGVISYSLYLVHLPIYQLCQPLIDTLPIAHAHTLVGLALLLPVLGLATLCYTAIEAPSRGLSRRLFNRRLAQVA